MSPGGRGGIVGRGAGRLAPVQIGADRVVAELGEASGDLLGGSVVTRHVVDDHHATPGLRAAGPGQIGLDLITAMTGDLDRLGVQ